MRTYLMSLEEREDILSGLPDPSKSSSTSDLHSTRPGVTPISQKRSPGRERLHILLDAILDSAVPVMVKGISSNLESWCVVAELLEEKDRGESETEQEWFHRKLETWRKGIKKQTRGLKKDPDGSGPSDSGSGGSYEVPPEDGPS